MSGIWHGANWTFIVWGCFHGLFQVIEKAIGQQKCNYGWLGKSIKIIITFALVNFAWIFFRMPTITDAWRVIQRIFDFTLPLTIFTDNNTMTFLIITSVLCLFIKDIFDEFFSVKLNHLFNHSKIIRWLSYVMIMIIILLTGVFSSDQFIYAVF